MNSKYIYVADRPNENSVGDSTGSTDTPRIKCVSVSDTRRCPTPMITGLYYFLKLLCLSACQSLHVMSGVRVCV